MPTASTPVTVPLRRIAEGSPGGLHPASASNDVRQLWKAIDALQKQLRSSHQSGEQLARKIETQRRRILGGAAGAITGMNFRGEYDPTATYNPNDVVVIRAGSNAGSYVAIAASGSTAPVLPDTGNLVWLSLSGNAPSLGAWMI